MESSSFSSYGRSIEAVHHIFQHGWVWKNSYNQHLINHIVTMKGLKFRVVLEHHAFSDGDDDKLKLEYIGCSNMKKIWPMVRKARVDCD